MSTVCTVYNKHGIPPTQYHIQPSGERAVRHAANSGPCFGNDIGFYGTNSPQQHFPYHYSDTTGKGKSTLTATDKFECAELEVFSVGC